MFHHGVIQGTRGGAQQWRHTEHSYLGGQRSHTQTRIDSKVGVPAIPTTNPRDEDGIAKRYDPLMAGKNAELLRREVPE